MGEQSELLPFLLANKTSYLIFSKFWFKDISLILRNFLSKLVLHTLAQLNKVFQHSGQCIHLHLFCLGHDLFRPSDQSGVLPPSPVLYHPNSWGRVLLTQKPLLWIKVKLCKYKVLRSSLTSSSNANLLNFFRAKVLS